MTSLEDLKRATKVIFDPYAEAKRLASEGYGIEDICNKTGVHEDIVWIYIRLHWNDRLRHAAYER